MKQDSHVDCVQSMTDVSSGKEERYIDDVIIFQIDTFPLSFLSFVVKKITEEAHTAVTKCVFYYMCQLNT